MNKNLNCLATNEGSLQTSLNNLIKQSKSLLNDKKTKENAILTLNLQIYFNHLMENFVSGLNQLFDSVNDQIYLIPFLDLLTQHKYCEDLICYISPKIHYLQGNLHILTNQIRTTLQQLTYLTCSIQNENKISVYIGKTYFISPTNVLKATNYDLPEITKSQLKSKLALTF